MENAIDRLHSLRVSDVMNKEVLQVSANESMAKVAGTLVKSHISSAPVVDEQGRCVGILSAVDFLRMECPPSAEERPFPAVAAGNVTPPEETHPHQIDAAREPLARDFMSPAVQTIAANASVLKAATVMCAEHIHRLPVLDSDGRVAGVVSTMDIVAALLNAIDESDVSLLTRSKH